MESKRKIASASKMVAQFLYQPGTTMFEITSDDISLLSDEDLRALVGRLCESEIRRRGFSSSAVTWGGHQNAKDGGVDVRVALPDGAAIDGFVPRAATGFQVKATDMPRAEILDEMRPAGDLRPVIQQLADCSGSYIIVSSIGSTSDLALQIRRDAMAEAIKDLPNAHALTLDFYDRTRLATWVRDHAGLIPWVRERIGKSIQGWQSYGAWAHPAEGVNGEYLLDDKIRIHTGKKEAAAGGIEALEGIHRIRETLREPGRLVRLIGLSGVGKTRFAQALFDERIGHDRLDSSLAIYTNVADSPEPPATAIASDLIASQTRTILVIDNCAPELHQRLSQVCRSPNSLVSVITIEYDIGEDQPEGTDVFSLEPSSITLIEKLLRHRFPEISPVDARTVAEMSDGNARVAIALAGTIGKNESIAKLSDQDLFKRLFQQRNEPDEALLLAAQALSLVYSYHGEDVSRGDEAELFRLGALVAKSSQEIFRSSAELQRRELVQQRGVWRAVLPHAIANRLAVIALQNIPLPDIQTHLVDTAPARLLKSFSRRLGYLSGSKEAEAIVSKWLGAGGLLENLCDLNELGRAMFNNIAPVSPQAALAALERVVLNAEEPETLKKCARYIHLVRSLAYDAQRFERGIGLILKIAEAHDVDRDDNEISKPFASLFTIYFSGTHATIEQRLSIINVLVNSNDAKKRALGLMALRASLEASHFGPGYNFEFGTRSRDFGYWPRTREDVKRWFGKTLTLTEALACSDHPSAPEVRTALADQFRGLWTGAALYEDLERVSHAISKRCFWTEGWIAVRQTIKYDSNGFNKEISNRLGSLEELLRPKDLVQNVSSVVLREAVIFTGIDSTHDGTNDVGKTMLQVQATARGLGKAVATDQQAFAELLPDLIGGSTEQLWNFGHGLAEGTEEPRETWNRLLGGLATADANKRKPHVFRGFLSGLRTINPNLVNELLDESLEHETLVHWYPVLQTAVGIDKYGVNRLMRSLDLGKIWIGMYGNLVFGGVTHQMSGQDFNTLVLRIAGEPEGWQVAVDILGMRLSFDEGRSQSSQSEIIEVGCQLLSQIRFDKKRRVTSEHTLRMIARESLVGQKGVETVQEICTRLRDAVAKSETYASSHSDLLQVLFTTQPLATLRAMCGEDDEDLQLGLSVLDDTAQLRRRPFDLVPQVDLLSWCDEQPKIRYPAAASGVTAFQPVDGRQQWTDTALKLLDKAPDRVEVLKNLIRQFSPMAWAGSRASIVELNVKLLDDLVSFADSALAEFISKEKSRLAQAVQEERQTEALFERARDERFE
jgi:hypothetical protein